MDTVAASPIEHAALRPALVFAMITLLGFGLLYSLTGTALGRLLFPHQATGSMVERDGRWVGSSLLAQPFADARYFHPRPSAADFDPMAASGSNAARSNPALRKRIILAISKVAVREGIPASSVPAELVTQSGSGLDPHLSPRSVQVQIARVAKARGLGQAEIEALVAAHTEAPQFGLFGPARVNVLLLDLALDALPR